MPKQFIVQALALKGNINNVFKDDEYFYIVDQSQNSEFWVTSELTPTSVKPIFQLPSFLEPGNFSFSKSRDWFVFEHIS